MSNRQGKRHKVGRFLIVCAVAACMLIFSASTLHARRSPFKPLTIFARALAHIEMNYVEPIDQDKLIYGAIRGMVGALDPHTTYLDPDEFRMLENDTEGRFAGIGVEVSIRDGWLTVLAVFDGGPAAKAGLLPGDKFLAIDDVDARDLRLMDAVRKMRGKKGSKVKLTVRRDGEQKAITRTLTRANIDLEPVESRLLPAGIVYVELNAFQENATSMLRDALDDAAKQLRKTGGVAGVILDMRDNGGGLLDQAVSVADEFLSSGVIVSTRGRGGKTMQVNSASRSRTRPDWPMVVLINAQTASAAEIVAAALRDHERAVLVGTRSFGKGSVQEVIGLPDRSALKVTIARYYSPAGMSIQARGITPDIVVEAKTKGESEGSLDAFREEAIEGHLAPGDNAKASKKAKRAVPPRPASVTVPPALSKDPQAAKGYQVLRAMIAKRQ